MAQKRNYYETENSKNENPLSQVLQKTIQTNLKTLSLTRIKSFPKDIFTVLGAIPTLEVLEIGDCVNLPDNFPVFLKGLTNLRSLRLENCYDGWQKFSKESFNAIQSLKHLKKLELINIQFTDLAEQSLEKCNGITALLVIPTCFDGPAVTNRYILDCLKKLSKTLTHVIWGFRTDLLYISDLLILSHPEIFGPMINVSETSELHNHFPILASAHPQPEDFDIPDIDEDRPENQIMCPIPTLQNWLDSTMVNCKTKIIKTYFCERNSEFNTQKVYLTEEFDDL